MATLLNDFEPAEVVENTDVAAAYESQYLTAKELKSFFSVITDPRDRAMFTVCYWRGLRASELGRLRLDSFDSKVGRLRFTRVKNSRGGNDLLSPVELRRLRAWVKVRGTAAGPLFPSSQKRGIGRCMVFRLFQAYAKLAQLPPEKRHPHVLKHSIASHLVAKQVEVLKIQRWLGHKSINSTLKYTHLAQADQDDLASRIYESE